MKKATVTLEIAADTFEDLTKEIFSLTLHHPSRKIIAYYVYNASRGVANAEHPSDASKEPDAPQEELPGRTDGVTSPAYTVPTRLRKWP